MAFHQLTSKNFRVSGVQKKTLDIDIGGKIFLFIKAEGCPGCASFFPIFQELARTDRRVGYAIVDISTPIEKAIVRMSRDTTTPIEAVPLILMYNNGSPIAKYKGRKNIPDIQNFITTILRVIEESHPPPTRSFVHDTPKGPYPPPQQYGGSYGAGGYRNDSGTFYPETSAGKQPSNSFLNEVEDDDDTLLSPTEVTPYNTPWKSDLKIATLD
jgi:thiol-disulfide isomerase/thioredoxin